MRRHKFVSPLIKYDRLSTVRRSEWPFSFRALASLPLENIRLHQHPGVEFISVLRGRLKLNTGSNTEFLVAGDSLYFDSQLPLGYSRAGTKPCSAVVVTAE